MSARERRYETFVNPALTVIVCMDGTMNVQLTDAVKERGADGRWAAQVLRKVAERLEANPDGHVEPPTDVVDR